MNLFSKLSVEELLECYSKLNEAHHTGVLHDIIDAYSKDKDEGHASVKAVNENLLEEIARRWVDDNRCTDLTALKSGISIWCVDYETGEIRLGKVKDRTVDSCVIEFDDGDFDEFYVKALGEIIFLSEQAAHKSIEKYNKNQAMK